MPGESLIAVETTHGRTKIIQVSPTQTAGGRHEPGSSKAVTLEPYEGSRGPGFSMCTFAGNRGVSRSPTEEAWESTAATACLLRETTNASKRPSQAIDRHAPLAPRYSRARQQTCPSVQAKLSTDTPLSRHAVRPSSDAAILGALLTAVSYTHLTLPTICSV